MSAFIDVNVIPMDTERVLRNQTVVVEGDRIVALGPSTTISVPATARRIDGRGKYLMPGFADMHVHGHNRMIAGSTDAQVATRLLPFITEGVTTIRSFPPMDSSLMQRLKKAEALGGPHIYLPAYDGSGTWRYRSLQNVPDSVATYFAEAKTAGYRFVYLHSGTVNSAHAKMSPATESLLTAAHRQGVAVAVHDHGPKFGKTLALGAIGGSIEHLAWFRDTLIGYKWQEFGPIGERETAVALTKLPALAAAVARAGVWVTPTLHCIIDSYNPPPRQTLLVQRIVKALQDAGVGLLLAGDDGYSVHDELGTLVRAGLTPYQALATGTRNVAQYLGLLDSSGTVTEGKRADLVLLSGNPLQDIRYTREPAGVMLHGEWLDRVELDRRLFTYRDTYPGFSSWFRLGLVDGAIVPVRDHPPADTSMSATIAWGKTRSELFSKFRARMERFEALSDSLIAMTSAEAGDGQPLRRRLAEELGVMRAMLPSEKHAAFDAVARLWLREQARQGHRLTVAGVTSALTP